MNERPAAETDNAGSATADDAEIIPLNVNLFAPAWTSVEELFRNVLQVIQTRFDFRAASIFLRGRDGGTLIRRSFISKSEPPAHLATVRVGHGLVGWVAANGKALLVSNLKLEGRALGCEKFGNEPVVSFAAAPVTIEGNVVGVIALESDQPGVFPPKETEEALTAIAALLARGLGAEEMLETQSQELEKSLTVRTIVQEVYDAAELDEAASEAVRHINALGEFHSVACFLKDEKGRLSRRASVGYNGMEGIHGKEPVAMRAATQAMEQCTAFRLEGAALAAQYRGAGEPQTVSDILLALPILYKGESLGALVVEIFSKINLNEPLTAILEETAGSLGGAFVRVYRAAMAENEAKTESELVGFSADLLDARSADEVWGKVFQRVLDRIDGTGVVVYRKAGNEFQLDAVAGCTPTRERISFNTTLVGWAALAGRPVIGFRNDRREAPIEEGTAFLACPIGTSDDLHSVLVAVVEDESRLTQDSVEWARQFFQVIHPILRKADQMERAADSIERDALSGLYNAAGLVKRAVALGTHGEVAALFVRIDNYDHLLAEFGRPEVERFLKRVANLLQSAAGISVLAARIEGGRFAFVAKGDLKKTRESVADALRSSTAGFLHDIAVTYSMAWAGTRDGIRVDELVHAAESRLSLIEKRVTMVANVA